MEVEIQIAPVVAPDIGFVTRPKICVRPLRIAGYFLVATLLPLFALLIYMDYAATHGITLEKGCHGPGVPFSFVSAILFALQLRFFDSYRS